MNSDRFVCEHCQGPSWQDHSFCEAVIEARERERVRLLRENPWLGFFKFNFDKWTNKHPNFQD